MLVSGSAPPDLCGVGDYTNALATGLARLKNTEVAVLTTVGDQPADATYLAMRILPDWRLRHWRLVWRALREFRPEIVHLQHPTRGFGDGWLPSLTGLLARVAGVRMVITWHEAFVQGQTKRFLTQWALTQRFITVRPDFAELMWAPLRKLLRWRRGQLILGASALPQTTLDDKAQCRLRAELLEGAERLIVFFGFLHPAKGVERLFELANPIRDRLLIVGEAVGDAAYQKSLDALVSSSNWAGRARMTGRLPAQAAANILAVADAVALPFLEGGGVWNSSIHAAVMQGTPVVTTARDVGASTNDGLVRYVDIKDWCSMSSQLDRVPEWCPRSPQASDSDEWSRIATEHMTLYRSIAPSNRRIVRPTS